MIRPEDQPGTQVAGVSEIVDVNDVKTEIVEVEDVPVRNYSADENNQSGNAVTR